MARQDGVSRDFSARRTFPRLDFPSPICYSTAKSSGLRLTKR